MTDAPSTIREFTRDLLAHAGALVATSSSGLDVVADAALSAPLGFTEFQSLAFTPDAARPGGALLVDYDSPTLDKMESLVDDLGRMAFVTSPPVSLKAFEPLAEVGRMLRLQNGVIRGAQVTPAEAVYFCFIFEYNLLADERAGSLTHVWVNPATRSVPQMNSWLDHHDLDELMPGAAPESPLTVPWTLAAAAVTAALGPAVAGFLDGLRRRRDRDVGHLREYYLEIDRTIRRKLERTPPGADDWRRESDRLVATARSYHARLVEVADRYRVRVLVRPLAVLACRLPIQRVTARLMRRNLASEAIFSWNPVDGRIESRCCDGCDTPLSAAWLCDDRVHILCESCLGPCGTCGRVYCPACHRQCPRRHDS